MELWQRILIYAVIGIVIRSVFAALKADKSEPVAHKVRPAQDTQNATWGDDDSTNKDALLSEPALMIERSLVFMAAIQNRPKLYAVSDRNARFFATSNKEPVRKTGEFAKIAFALEHKTADDYRSLLLSAVLNKKYLPHAVGADVDVTVVNIGFGLAVLSQNSTLEPTEEEAWRLLLLSKAKDVYPDYGSAFAAMIQHYQAIHADLVQDRKFGGPHQADSNYAREQEKQAAEDRKTAARIDKQLSAIIKLNADTSWRRHMQKSWEQFQPMRIEEMTKVERSNG